MPADELSQRVAAIADALVAEGKKVTNDTVREELGGGSLRDISPAVREWKQGQLVPEVSEGLPTDIMALIKRTATTIWGTALSQANEEMSALRSHTQTRISEMAQERDEAFEELGDLEEELEKIKRELKSSIKAEIAADLQVAGCKERIEIVSGENEKLRKEVEQMRQSMLTVRSESATVTAELKSEVYARKKAESAAENAHANAIIAGEAAAELRGQLKALEK